MGALSSLPRVQGALEAARSAYDSGQWGLAEAGCRAVLRGDPRCVDALYLLAKVMLRTRQTQLAIAFLEKAVALDPDQPDLRTTLGSSLLSLGRFDDGEGHLRRAIDLDPTTAKPHKILGLAAGARGDDVAAAAHFARSLELDPA